MTEQALRGYPEPEWLEMGMCMRVIFRSHLDIAASEPANVPVNVPANEGVNEGVTGYAVNERQCWIEFVGAPKTGYYRIKPQQVER